MIPKKEEITCKNKELEDINPVGVNLQTGKQFQINFKTCFEVHSKKTRQHKITLFHLSL